MQNKKVLKERLIKSSRINRKTECWNWRLSKNGNGRYGRISVNGKDCAAHRIAYECFVGPISRGLNVLHRCDNPGCINPDHLFLGKQEENVQDMIRKGRANFYGRRKLTERSVRSIRKQIELGRSMYLIAQKYHVTYDAIYAIYRERSWRHIN
jgi:hypothetical protein